MDKREVAIGKHAPTTTAQSWYVLFTKISGDLQVQITIKDMDKREVAIGKHAPTTTAQSWYVPRKGTQTVQHQ